MTPALDESVNNMAVAVVAHAPVLALILVGSVVAYVATLHYIPRVAATLFERNIFGIDINKTTPEQRKAFVVKRRRGETSEKSFRKQAVPESLGILAGAVYLSVVMVLTVCLGYFRDEAVDMHTSLPGPLTTITVMLLLGFVDDVLDLRWRHKIILTTLGSLPLIMTYDGSLSVLMPRFFSFVGLPTVNAARAWLMSLAQVSGNETPALAATSPSTWLPYAVNQSIFEVRGGGAVLVYLGPLYLLYLSMLCIFCTNSINILAGVNGVEVGQSIVIALASVVYNLLQLRLESEASTLLADARAQDAVAVRDMSSDHQIRALLLLGPFIGVSLAIWHYNRYPARIFVGDSYTYFAGTVLAVSGITGVYSKTLLLFFAPQVFNFLISTPQLFGIVVCPRHRVPNWNPKTNLLTNSHNYTILNVILYYCGDMHEAKLTCAVLKVQVAVCVMGFVIRYVLSSFLYDEVH